MPADRPYCVNQVEHTSDGFIRYCLDFFNKRLRVDDYKGCMADYVLQRSRELADNHALTKLFIKSREEDWQIFLSGGCMLEGIYKGYFDGKDAYCMAMYFDLERRTSDFWMEEDRILKQVCNLPVNTDRRPLERTAIRIASAHDAEPLAELYRQVFQTYPTPMDNAEYIVQTMLEGTIYYVVENDNVLISAASAEINKEYRNAELTDCATLPAFRNQGHMRLLIHALEKELERRDIACAYSLARALSFGMNAVFFQLGYRYYGRLTKNCDIYDKFEDVNLWVKMLPKG